MNQPLRRGAGAEDTRILSVLGKVGEAALHLGSQRGGNAQLPGLEPALPLIGWVASGEEPSCLLGKCS